MRDLLAVRERLARLSPGGSREHPISVGSAAVVEPHASGMTCPLCEAGQYRIEDHAAPESGLRRLEVRCRQCGAERTLWFRLVSFEPN